MALGFFRRRQKMVMIIMAVLMVAFLVGFQGFSMLLSGRGGSDSIGTILGGRVHIRTGDIRQASFDLNVQFVNVGLLLSQYIPPPKLAEFPTTTQFLMIVFDLLQ